MPSLTEELLDYINERKYRKRRMVSMIRLAAAVIIALVIVFTFDNLIGIPRLGIGCIDVPPPSVSAPAQTFCWIELRSIWHKR